MIHLKNKSLYDTPPLGSIGHTPANKKIEIEQYFHCMKCCTSTCEYGVSCAINVKTKKTFSSWNQYSQSKAPLVSYCHFTCTVCGGPPSLVIH